MSDMDLTKEEMYEAIELSGPTDAERDSLKKMVETGDIENFLSALIPLLEREDIKEKRNLEDLAKESDELIQAKAAEAKSDEEIDDLMDEYYETNFAKPSQELDDEDKEMMAKLDEIDTRVQSQLNKLSETTSKKQDQSMLERIRSKLRKG